MQIGIANFALRFLKIATTKESLICALRNIAQRNTMEPMQPGYRRTAMAKAKAEGQRKPSTLILLADRPVPLSTVWCCSLLLAAGMSACIVGLIRHALHHFLCALARTFPMK